MWMDGKELWAGRVYTTEYKCRTDVALVSSLAMRRIPYTLRYVPNLGYIPEEHLLEHGHGSHYPRFASG